jgi:hypothetical protein
VDAGIRRREVTVLEMDGIGRSGWTLRNILPNLQILLLEEVDQLACGVVVDLVQEQDIRGNSLDDLRLGGRLLVVATSETLGDFARPACVERDIVRRKADGFCKCDQRSWQQKEHHQQPGRVPCDTIAHPQRSRRLSRDQQPAARQVSTKEFRSARSAGWGCVVIQHAMSYGLD